MRKTSQMLGDLLSRRDELVTSLQEQEQKLEAALSENASLVRENVKLGNELVFLHDTVSKLRQVVASSVEMLEPITAGRLYMSPAAKTHLQGFLEKLQEASKIK